MVGTVPILCETQLKRAACPGSAIDWQTTPADKCRPLDAMQSTMLPRSVSHGRGRVHPSFPQGDDVLRWGIRAISECPVTRAEPSIARGRRW